MRTAQTSDSDATDDENKLNPSATSTHDPKKEKGKDSAPQKKRKRRTDNEMREDQISDSDGTDDENKLKPSATSTHDPKKEKGKDSAQQKKRKKRTDNEMTEDQIAMEQMMKKR